NRRLRVWSIDRVPLQRYHPTGANAASDKKSFGIYRGIVPHGEIFRIAHPKVRRGGAKKSAIIDMIIPSAPRICHAISAILEMRLPNKPVERVKALDADASYRTPLKCAA